MIHLFLWTGNLNINLEKMNPAIQTNRGRGVGGNVSREINQDLLSSYVQKSPVQDLESNVSNEL